MAKTRNQLFSLVIAPQGDAPAKNNSFDAGVVVAFKDRAFVTGLLRSLVWKLGPADRLLPARPAALGAALPAVRARRW
eukprot:7534553-Lingulodinium_polyedra.AAC.1